jgi:Protein of unknown function (DUF2934)
MTNIGTAQSKTPTKSESVEVTPERIQFRAYEIYVARGSAPGSDVEDWLQAERELSQQNQENPRQNQQNQATRPIGPNKPNTTS